MSRFARRYYQPVSKLFTQYTNNTSKKRARYLVSGTVKAYFLLSMTQVGRYLLMWSITPNVGNRRQHGMPDTLSLRETFRQLRIYTIFLRVYSSEWVRKHLEDSRQRRVISFSTPRERATQGNEGNGVPESPSLCIFEFPSPRISEWSVAKLFLPDKFWRGFCQESWTWKSRYLKTLNCASSAFDCHDRIHWRAYYERDRRFLECLSF